jgi:iron complex outermembrane receptor protein
MQRHFPFILFTVSVLSGLHAQNTQQQATDQNNTPLPVVKTVVVVTATRSETELRKAPVSASIVTHEENALRNVHSLDQALNLTEGVYSMRYTPSGSMNKVMMRGFDSAARTLVLVDGQPLNDGYNGSVTWASMPVEEVERVEVARGSFSSLYGGSAMGGVINVLTRPIERRSLELMGQYGSNDTSYWSVRAADRFFNRLGVSAAFQRYQSGGFVTKMINVSGTSSSSGTAATGAIPTYSSTGSRTYRIGTMGPNWSAQEVWRLKGDYTLSPSTVVTLQYIHQETDYGFDTGTSFLRDASGNTLWNGPALINDNGATKRVSFTPGSFLSGTGYGLSHWINGSLQHKFDARRTFRVAGGFYKIPSDQSMTPTASTATSAGGPGSLSSGSNHSFWGDGQLNWRPTTRHEVVLGSEVRQNEADNREFDVANWTRRDILAAQTYQSHGQTFNQAVYAQDQIRLFEPLTITAGGRYDYWKASDGMANGFTTAMPLTEYAARSTHAFSGKLSAVYSAPRGWTLRASAGTSFRNPSIYELYRTWRSATGVLYNANPELDAERLNSVETGVRKQFGTRLGIEATYYYNRISNLIYRKTDYDKDSTGNWRINMNAGEGRTHGIEYSANAKLNSWLQFKTNYNYTEAVISKNSVSTASEGKRVPNTPKHMGSASLIASRGRFSGMTTGRYVGATFSSDTSSDTTKGVYGAYDPFFVWDASLGYQITPRVQVFANTNNLLDRSYFVYYLQAGRTVNVGLRIRM